MAFSSQVDHSIYIIIVEYPPHLVKIANILFNEEIVGLSFHITQVVEITCIGQFIQVDNPVFRIFIDEQPHNARANKPAPPVIKIFLM